MWKVLLFLSFVLVKYQVRTADGDDFSLDEAISQIFKNCTCVYHYQCDKDGFIIDDGTDIIGIRKKEPPDQSSPLPKCQGGNFEGELLCCETRPDDNNPPPNQVITHVSPVVTPSSAGSTIVKCGKQRTLLDQRFSTADKFLTDEDQLVPTDGQFPWITAIYKKNRLGVYEFYSSGSLIAPRVVLTANHYFHRMSPHRFKVVANGHVLLSSIGDKPLDEREVVEIVSHPDYHNGVQYYDAALLILKEPVDITLNNTVNSICLPPDMPNLVGKTCITAGWGKGPEEINQKEMKNVDLPYVDITECEQLLRKTRLGSGFNLHKSFICAGGEEGRDACQGDGGSPLMCPLPTGPKEPRRYFIAGIVSWGIGCGQKDVPGVYANVHEVKGWILKELLQRKITVDLN